MMKIRVNILSNYFIISQVLILSVMFMGYTNTYSKSVRGVTDTSIKIGLISDQTGPIAGDIGLPVTDALRIYTQYINDKGGIFGRKAIVLVEDDRYAIPAAIAAFKKLVFKDRIFILIGPVSTGGNKALFSQIDKNEVPNISVAPDEAMINPLRKYTFMPFNLYDDQLGVIFNYIVKDLKQKNIKITFVYFDAESGKVALASTEKWAKFFNFKFDTEIINLGSLDATSQVMSIKRKKPTHIVIHHGSPGMVVLLRDLKKFGLHTPVFGTTIACTEDTVKMARSASKNSIGAHPFCSWHDDFEGPIKMREITLKYRPNAKKKSRSMMYTAGWVASTTVYEGIKKAGRDLNVESVLRGLEAITNLDTKGLSGPINFSPTNHKGVEHSKLYEADPESGRLIPITDWRKAPVRKKIHLKRLTVKKK